MSEYLKIREFETARACEFGNFKFSKLENLTLRKLEIFEFRASKIKIYKIGKSGILETQPANILQPGKFETPEACTQRNAKARAFQTYRLFKFAIFKEIVEKLRARNKFPPNLKHSFSMLLLEFLLITN